MNDALFRAQPVLASANGRDGSLDDAQPGDHWGAYKLWPDGWWRLMRPNEGIELPE